MLVWLLLTLDAVVFFAAGIFALQSRREKETRATTFGWSVVLFHLFLVPIIIGLPPLRLPVAVLFALYLLFILACLIPGRAKPRGAMDHVVGEAKRFDERDIVFARIEGLRPGSEPYIQYYEAHPEKKAYDDKRRESGGFPVGPPGAIDGGYPPNTAMTEATFHMCGFMGDHAVANPDPEAGPHPLTPEKATSIIKNFALHLGADLVGVCRVNPLWVYSHKGEIHYGEWEEWGKEKPGPLPFAVVFATEMGYEHVRAAPHTPTLAESATQYCKGEYISTILAQWFAAMGYRAVAQHFLHYDLLPVPLAVDAGLGELGRLGYLISRKFGPRVRVFATTTDMPLIPDQPISIGADDFCRRCKKCATACPSGSIPEGEKSIYNGIRKWKLDEESCYAFWGRAGTDCGVCMGICPFSRPDTPLHRVVRWFVARSPVARTLFPYMDNLIYGKKWKPATMLPWLAYPKGSRSASNGPKLKEGSGN
jgi:reductive dehalogenase